MFHPWPKLRKCFAKALEQLGDARPARIAELRNSSLFFLLHYLSEITADERHLDQPTTPILLVTETNQSAIRMCQFLVTAERLVTDREPLPSDYLVFPDFEPQNLFEYSELPIDLIDQRNQVLDALGRHAVKAVVASFKACWRKLPDPNEYYGRHLTLAAKHNLASSGASGRGVRAQEPILGDAALTTIGRDELAQRLAELGYRRTTTVLETGEFAVRGGLVDVFPLGANQPVRIDLFGDDIDQLQYFDPQTQRTTEPVNTVRILPLSTHVMHFNRPEVLGDLQDGWQVYRRGMEEVLSRSTFQRLCEVVESDLEHLADGTDCPRAGWYYRASLSDNSCLWHYLPEQTMVVIHEQGFIESETASYFRFWEKRFADWLKNGLSFLGLDSFYFSPPNGLTGTAEGLAIGKLSLQGRGDTLSIQTPRLKPLFTYSFAAPDDDQLPMAEVGLNNPPAAKWGTTRLAQTVTNYLPLVGVPRIDRPVTILSQFSARLREVLSDSNVHPEVENAILPGGFVLPPDDMWTVITDAEIFGEIADVAPAPVRRFKGQALRRPDELAPGDFVVHIDYGIGRFAQLTNREIGSVLKSFVEIEYAGRDRLYVPVEQLDRLRRYSYDGTTPALNSLGRDTWRKTKEKVRRDTLELARRLLSLYKTRQVRAGFAYSESTIWQQEFAEGFPYELTDDQLKAWREVEFDMESDKPMDRLLVGDVGFGKTEVAMRAAFKACVDERQVLVLCPTTVLADQHYRTFSRRFSPFPFRVGQLSRFQSAKEQKATIEKLATGRLDVVVATHRALSKDVGFKNFGLLIIDEEQRFGVKQKESWKMRWPTVDVLAMSATPIPRTLHMSLIGVRDISLIETAPQERKAVKTYVGEHDEILIREAILRELGRGGQIYYLHNRVQDIDRVKERLETLVPDSKVIVAHGQMREERLEEVMHAFSLGAYRILLATTIIENGLDIAAVNTIIVDNAENLGLAQMHQLRGRVGRSPVQAYSYFFHQPNRVLSEEAQNRLHAIYNYAYLGAGYEIAQSDLRIRGAGNLLGEAQSGLAKQVGFEYYCELLARSISDVKALDEAAIEEWDDRPLLAERPATQLDLPLPSFIPETYISDPVLRLEILRDLAALTNEEDVEGFATGLADRFGEPPTDVENLLTVVRVRNLASSLGIEQLSYNRVKKHFEVRFFEDEPLWFKRAPLADSRFSQSGEHAMVLELPFEGQATGTELFDALSGMLSLKSQQ